MNTIKYRELQDWYLNEEARELAKTVFGDNQPSIFRTGFYSAPSWNWGYQIGLCSVNGKVYEVVTQFGEVKGAKPAYIPELRSK